MHPRPAEVSMQGVRGQQHLHQQQAEVSMQRVRWLQRLTPLQAEVAMQGLLGAGAGMKQPSSARRSRLLFFIPTWERERLPPLGGFPCEARAHAGRLLLLNASPGSISVTTPARLFNRSPRGNGGCFHQACATPEPIAGACAATVHTAI